MSEIFKDFIYINDDAMDESSCEEITNYVLTDMSKNNEKYAIHNAELESQKNKLSNNHLCI